MRVQEVQKIELQVSRGENSSYAFVLSVAVKSYVCAPLEGDNYFSDWGKRPAQSYSASMKVEAVKWRRMGKSVKEK